MTIYRPQWLTDMEVARGEMDEEVRAARNRYFLKAAALAHSPRETLKSLASDAGIHYHLIIATFRPDHSRISAEMVLKIERTVGKDVLPCRILRPDLFD